MKNQTGTMKTYEKPTNHEYRSETMKNHENRPGAMKNQPGTMKTMKTHLKP